MAHLIAFLQESGFFLGILRMDSIYVTNGGDWLLAGTQSFLLLLGYEVTHDKDSVYWFKENVSKCKNVQKYQPQGNIRYTENHDVYLFGCLCIEVYNGEFNLGDFTSQKKVPRVLISFIYN